jgi:hypothetical protein
MMAQADGGQPLVMVQPMGAALRVLLGAAGASCAFLAARELVPGVWPIGWHSIFVGALLAGALAVCGTLVIAALFGNAIRMTVSDDGMLVEKSSPFGRRIEQLRPGSVAALSVVENEWDSGSSTWAIEIECADGRVMLTPDFRSKRAAEEASAVIARRMKVER